ncbi:MAG: carbohydrate kinase family protein [Actinomycetota bacterium]|nr:carbohydrate kinase family protein [Actinomycetota bacterium]
MVLCTLGDLLLDVIVRLDESLAAGTDAQALTRAGAGGQAANVAAWAASLGAEARFVGKRGNDAAAELAFRELTGHGVEVLGPVAVGRNGIVVSLVNSNGDRTMATDRGVAPSFARDEVDPAWFAGSTHLHLSGYSVMSSPIDGAAVSAAALVREQGGTVSVDLASTRIIRAFGAARVRERLDELRLDVVFSNEAELDEIEPVRKEATWVIKRGARGCTVEREGEGTDYAALETEVVDTTGAGDALAAGFLVGGPELGLQAAARCIAKLGAMP